MTRRSKSFATLALALAAGCAPAAVPAPSGPRGADGDAAAPTAPAPSAAVREAEVRNLILLIADGAGAGHWSAAHLASDAPLAVSRMPVGGLVDTRSASARTTDSAAGATVYATGVRVTNRTIGVAPTCPRPAGRDTVTTRPPGCEPLENWFEIARAAGKATGIVTTTEVTDATPAAFTAHSPSRYWSDQIAEQQVAAGLDVILGGGRRSFVAETRNDRRDLLGPLCARAACVSSAAELAAYRADDRPLVGLFGEDDLGYRARERAVALPDMASAALARLARDPDGFVVLLESEGTDHVGHRNYPLPDVAADMLEFDRTVAVALEFAARHPGTLVLVLADHETGGLTMPEEADTTAAYSTRGHTPLLVPLFAAGPGAERFGGLQRNDEVGRTLMAIARGWR